MKRLEWEPRTYQREAVKWLLSHPAAGLFLDPGLGKTSISTESFRLIKKAGGTKKALVIAPLRPCYMVWTHEEGGELAKWQNFKDVRVTLLHGSKKDKALEQDADMYVINPAGLEWLIESGGLASLFKRGVDTLIADELSQFKHRDTKRFRTIAPFLSRFRRRWGLTGSPASNGLLDLFGQVYMLDLGRAFGPYFTRFRQEFFVPAGFKGYNWTIQEDGETRIYDRLKPLVLAMRAVDHLDMPPLVEQDLFVVLPKKARQAYDELEAELFTSLDEGLVTAANVAVSVGKCRQVASGGVYRDDDSGRHAVQLHDEKTEALKELMAELQGQPLLVSYEFHHDLARLKEAFGKDLPAINGETKPAAARDIANAWNRGDLPLLVVHPQAAGHGLNLQAGGRHVCWYSLTWNYELYDQLIRRVWRQGQKKQVFVYRLLARDTVDEVILSALEAKRRGQNNLMVALRTRRGSKQKSTNQAFQVSAVKDALGIFHNSDPPRQRGIRRP